MAWVGLVLLRGLRRRTRAVPCRPACASSVWSSSCGAKPLFDLWIRLDIDPNEVSSNDHVFRLRSSDGLVDVNTTMADDHVPNDRNIDLC
jgi:hypothetical protein